MKASEKEKQSVSYNEIINQIKDTSKNHFKHFIPHFVYVSDEVKIKLGVDGYKVYQGEWFKGDIGLIIEW